MELRGLSIFVLCWLAFWDVYAQSELSDGSETAIPEVELEGVVVTAPVQEITIKGDTAIINALAYKVSQGAYLEELVKRIPGMEYDRKTKTLTYNGRELKEINVNGKSFFGSNVVIALENLPADIISRLKVYDKSKDEDKFLGIRSGKDNLVLDLITNKNIDGSLMAISEILVGNHNKKEASLMAHYFRSDGDNFSVNMNGGNKNMDTDYRNNRDRNVSMNFWKNIGNKLSVNGNLMVAWRRDGNNFSGVTEQFIPENTNYNYNALTTVGKNRSLSSMLGCRWMLNENTYININGNYNRSLSCKTDKSRQAAFDSDPGLNVKDPFEGDVYEKIPIEFRINDIRMDSKSETDNESYYLNASVSRILNKRGASIRVSAGCSDFEACGDGFSVSSTAYYRIKGSDGMDSLLYRNQYNKTPLRNFERNVGIMFMQPLTKDMKLSLGYSYKTGMERNDRSVYDLSAFSDDREEYIGFLPDDYAAGYIDSLSNNSRSRFSFHEMNVSLDYYTDIWQFMLNFVTGSEHRALDRKTGLLKADTVRSAFNIRPSFHVTWHKDQISVNFSYIGYTHQPSLSDMLSQTDNSNPLYITHGNPNLKAAYNQDVRIDFHNEKIGLSCGGGFSGVYNELAHAVIYDSQSGGSVVYPVNVNGNCNFGLNFGYRKVLFRKFRLFFDGRLAYNRNVGIVDDDEGGGPQKSVTRIRSSRTSCRMLYMPVWGSFDFSFNWDYSTSFNGLRQAGNHISNYRFNLGSYTDFSCGLQFRCELGYDFKNGTNLNTKDDSQILWNLEVAWRFLKKKEARLSFYWADILSDKKAFNRYVSASGIVERYNRQIGSYFMVSLRYNFNKNPEVR